jgi:ceramide glucosyltransferase
MQTIRSLNPLGYAFTFVSFTFPIAALGLLLAPTRWNAAIAAIAMAARLALHARRPAAGVPAPGHAALAPLRDGLLLLTWLCGFVGANARWRERSVPVRDPAEPLAMRAWNIEKGET